MIPTRFFVASLVSGLGACTLPPLRGEMEIGKDAYAVFVGPGSGGSDLYAVRPGGGVAIALTFSPVAESAPALSPDGATLGFIRTSADSVGSVWLMNLLSGGEREIELPRGANAVPRRVGWGRGGTVLYIDTDRGIWRAEVPPRGADAVPVDRAELAAADTALRVLVGDPTFAAIERCDSTPGSLCSRSNGTESVVAGDAEFGARWGSDSMAFVRAGAIEVRPVGPGRPRRVELSPAREVTGGLAYFGGTR
ncbi:MAG TPA: hypothetical protein VFT04_04090 [Gemmatimonadales bacterium]|nr:hypothetical protein [Gemmatimonadales bacterium]